MTDKREELISCFDFVGQTLNEKLIRECLSLCSTYEIPIEDFVDSWSAFSISHLRSAPISLENVKLLENKVLSSSGFKISNIEHETKENHGAHANIHPVIKPALEIIPKEAVHVPSRNDDTSCVVDSQSDHSRSIESQSLTQHSYAERTNAGETVAKYGNPTDLTESKQIATVEIISKSKWYLPTNYKYMNATQMKVSNAYNNTIDNLSHSIMKTNNLTRKTDINDSNDVIVGRIRSEDLGRLDANNVRLEGSYSFNGAKVINLDLKSTNSYSLFPGQIAVARGLHMTGNTFVTEQVFTSAAPEYLNSTPQFIEDLNIVVAAGPYSLSDNVLFEPLQDLLKFVVEKKPSVLVLLGPFTDFTKEILNTFNESIETYFESLVDNIMETVALARPEMKVILVSSLKDTHFHPVFPTPAYNIKQKYPNLICAPNPCLLNINGLVMGAITADVLFHFSKEEMSKNPMIKDRMSRLAAHLIDQGSFYPLFPSYMPVDYERLLNDCPMSVKPHVLILPSMLRYFIKEERGCVFVNPERLVKGKTGGTFATITVGPPEGGMIVNNISCQIRKI